MDKSQLKKRLNAEIASWYSDENIKFQSNEIERLILIANEASRRIEDIEGTHKEFTYRLRDAIKAGNEMEWFESAKKIKLLHFDTKEKIKAIEYKILNRELGKYAIQLIAHSLSNGDIELINGLLKIYKHSTSQEDFCESGLFDIAYKLMSIEKGYSHLNGIMITKHTTQTNRKNAYAGVFKASQMLTESLSNLRRYTPLAHPEIDNIQAVLSKTMPKLLDNEKFELPLHIKRPNTPNARRLLMLKEMRSYFKRYYQTPLNDANLALTSLFYDCKTLTIQDVAKLKV